MTIMTEERKFQLRQAALYLGLSLRAWDRTAVRDAVYAVALMTSRNASPVPGSRVSLRAIDNLFGRLVRTVLSGHAEAVDETVDRLLAAASLD
jgi:hypothetical protein